MDFVFLFLGFVTTLYLVIGYEGLVHRQGLMSTITILSFTIPYEIIIGSTGIILLLEATRRVVGLPLVIIAVIFILYSFFGRILPDLIAHPGLSLNRLVGYHWLGGEAMFGIPISVSVGFIFLFVLFGSVLDAAGGGKYFFKFSIRISWTYARRSS